MKLLVTVNRVMVVNVKHTMIALVVIAIIKTFCLYAHCLTAMMTLRLTLEHFVLTQ
jgi:hypothetical protein